MIKLKVEVYDREKMNQFECILQNVLLFIIVWG